MEFFKKNYEKIVLVVVLLGLTVAACALPFIISSKRAALDNLIVNTVPHPKPLPKLDMSQEETALQRAQSPLTLDYTTKHNLFNPVLWKKRPDGGLIKETTGNEEGAGALVITGLKPLYLQVSFGSTNGTGYFINIERQAALHESKRHLQRLVSKENNKGDLVTLQDVKGTPDKPELDFIWNETGEPFVVAPDKPFRKIESYAADLKYPLEPNKTWSDKRVGSSPLYFANGSYKIVAITDTNVVVLDQSNNKKTTITFHPATEPR